MLRAIAFIVLLSLVPVVASAQTSEPAPRHADYTTSIALHITAVTLAVASTVAFLFGSVLALGNAIGGGGPSDPAETPLLVGGTIGLLAAVGVGIAATVVHGNTRASAQAAHLEWLPLGWVDAHGAGAGLTLRF
jgi:hypothetical protein